MGIGKVGGVGFSNHFFVLPANLPSHTPSKKKKGRKKKRRRSNTPPAVASSDLPTAESLEAARVQLEAGATDVTLSPGGYFRYRRTLSGSSITAEELLAGGIPVLTWNHTATESTGQGDADRDGFSESRTRIVRGQSLTDERVELTDYSPTTRALIRRQTYTRTGPDTIHVLWERDNG
ncbi:MAG: hypothetical protein LC674_03390, partial [Actinobacteria bacterium]|nr:hypothetical protein [Actinomycetota bacterium]